MLCRISVLHLRSALHYCATAPIQKFNRRRVSTGTDWVSEYRRFAFGREPN